MTSLLTTLDNYWLKIQDEAQTIMNYAYSFFTSAVESEVTALAPIVEQAIAQLSIAEANALVSGNTSQTGHILAGVVSSTIQQVEATGIKAGAAAILTAVSAGVSNAPNITQAVAAKAQPAQTSTSVN